MAHATGLVGHERHVVQGCDGTFVRVQGTRVIALGAIVVGKRGVAKHDLRLVLDINSTPLLATNTRAQF